jgi:hypothetical protein
MEQLEVHRGMLERVAYRFVQVAQRALARAARHLERIKPCVVEAEREVAQRRVAAAADVANDRAYC